MNRMISMGMTGLMVTSLLCPGTVRADGRDAYRHDSGRGGYSPGRSYHGSHDYHGGSYHGSGYTGWATAGALIAGLAIGSIATESCSPRVTYYTPTYYRPVYITPPVQTIYVTQPVETRVVYTTPQAVSYPTTVIQQPGVVQQGGVVQQTVIQSPIIRDLGNGRRLYQDPVKGAPAYLQAWSSIRNEWVSLEEQPSLW